MRPEDVPPDRTAAPEPPAPGPRDLLSGAAGRRAWLRWHLTDRAVGGAQVLLFHLFSHLPVGVSDACGGALGRAVQWIDRRRPYQRHMEAGLAWIRPELRDDPGARARLMRLWWRQAGRAKARFAALERLAAPGRVQVHGRHHLEALRQRDGPSFLLLVHLGDWEAIGLVQRSEIPGNPGVGIFEPQANRFQNRLVHRLRRRNGLVAFPPGPGLVPLLLRMVSQGGACGAFFVDERRNGVCRFPLFGRPLAPHGNIRFCLKLASRTGAHLLPAYLLTRPDGGISLTVIDTLPPLSPRAGRDEVEARAHALSELFEPVIRAHPEQWNMLQHLRIPLADAGIPDR